MRITNAYIYSQNLSNFQRHQNNINTANNMISSGSKIGQSYEDASMYSEGARLVYELGTFTQVIEAGNKAVNITKNSDQAIKEISSSLDQFKNKLIQGANEVHSDTSLNALANDLEAIKKHIVNLANTSINGQFLFSGTSIGTKPFDENGNYFGNSENMQVILGSGVYTDYNISGYELMKSKDNDYNKIISTNVRMVDRRYDINEPDQIHYISEDSKIRDLIGKEYIKDGGKGELNVDDHFYNNDGAKFPETYFYVRGTKGNGKSFKAKFEMKPDENISAMLDKIGNLYGNTTENRVVDVKLTKDGTIEITDLKNAESRLNFSMFAATARADDIDQLYQPKPQDLPEGAIPATPIPVNANIANVSDPKELRGNKNIFVLEFTNNGNIGSDFSTDGIDYSRSLFNKKDNVLSSNVSQIDKAGNVATDNTRLVDTALSKVKLQDDKGATSNSVISMKVTSQNKTRYNIDVDLTKGEVSATYTQNGKEVKRTFPITNVVYDQALHKSDSFKTDNIDINYKQLGDIISLFATDNIPSKDYKLEKKYPDQENSPMILSKDDHIELQSLLKKAKNSVEVGLDERGKMQLVDKTATTTKIDLAMYDKNTMDKGEFDFGVGADGKPITTGVKSGDMFNFNTNSSLVIDENHVDIIKDLDKMIEAVRNGNYRADSDNPNLLKSVGIQGALKRIDHIQDHINKVHTKIGATQKSIEDASNRATMMSVNIQDVKSQVIDADYGESIMLLMQHTQALQATLQASAQVSKLSLLNYM